MKYTSMTLAMADAALRNLQPNLPSFPMARRVVSAVVRVERRGAAIQKRKDAAKRGTV